MESFESFVLIEPNCGCWLWNGSSLERGYGRFRGSLAHRVSWVLHNGPIPDGMHVCHRCDVTACVNPAHLFLGTALDNIRDMHAKGRDRNGQESKTNCPRGHALEGANLVTRKGGWRSCRTCCNDLARAKPRVRTRDRSQEHQKRVERHGRDAVNAAARAAYARRQAAE